jgi:lipopolysaccharide assembly outer membrane protein LptD (OstA)
MQRQIRYFFLLKTFLLLLCCANFAVAQTGTSSQKKGGGTQTPAEQQTPQNTPPPFRNDTIFKTPPPGVVITTDTTQRRKSSGDIDTVITYKAKDSVTFFLKTKKMRLRGNAEVNFRDQKLQGEVIEIEFDRSTITASAVRDSAGNLVGQVPTFTDQGEPYVGERLSYNFKTRRGSVDLGETKMGEGFYFGSKIKRVDESTLFIKDGFYTTCDAPDPHYYFGSPQMKVIVQDRVFVDPLILYVEDLPVFAVPFGLFFPNRGGRQSGLIVPSFFFARDRGVVLQNLGYYFALSDYYDTKVVFEQLTSKGGFVLNNEWRYAWNKNSAENILGRVSASYGKTRTNTDADYNTNWKLNLNHDQTIDPFKRFTANLEFLSNDFNRNVSTNIYERLEQTVFSSATYNQSFTNSTLSLDFVRTQNLSNGNITQEFPRVRHSINTLQPFKETNLPETFREASVSSQLSGFYRLNRTQAFETDEFTGAVDTTTRRDHQSLISWNPEFVITPKFGYVSITPRFRFESNLYFRRIAKRTFLTDTKFTDEMEAGFFPEYTFSGGIDFSTKLYGRAYPNIFSITGIQHILEPIVSFTYRPDQTKNNNFFGNAQKQNGNIELYSRFAKDGNTVASDRPQGLINITLRNNFQAKIDQPDTIPDLTIGLLNASVSAEYNTLADSLPFSPINFNISTPSMGSFALNASGQFDFYDIQRDTLGNPLSANRVNRYLFESDMGLARLTNVTINLQANFSSEGLRAPAFGVPSDSVGSASTFDLGSRFRKRNDIRDEIFDEYGDSSPGYSLINIPWTLGFNAAYSLTRNAVNGSADVNFSVNSNVTVDLTPTWRMSTSLFYDLKRGKIEAPSINITKDLHCWFLRFDWYPSGTFRGYYLQFGIKAPELQDLKIESRSNPLFN